MPKHPFGHRRRYRPSAPPPKSRRHHARFWVLLYGAVLSAAATLGATHATVTELLNDTPPAVAQPIHQATPSDATRALLGYLLEDSRRLRLDLAIQPQPDHVDAMKDLSLTLGDASPDLDCDPIHAEQALREAAGWRALGEQWPTIGPGQDPRLEEAGKKWAEAVAEGFARLCK